jgi:large subunit ribosomal protein L4
VSPSNFDKAGLVEQKVVSLSSGDETAVASLKKSIFERYPIRADLLQRVVVWQLAKRRQGTAKSKNRAEVSGSTVKGAPQKGRG